MVTAPVVSDIFGFKSPVAYLIAVIDAERQIRSDFSLVKIAASMGLSRSGLSLILNGRRKIVHNQIHSIARALHLDSSSHEYWESMCMRDLSVSEEDRNWYQARMHRSQEQRVSIGLRSPSQSLAAAWFVPALLVYLIDLAGSVLSAEDIASRMGLPVDQVKQALESLSNEGFLKWKGSGNIHISFERLAASVSAKRHLKQVYAEGIKRMEHQFDDRNCYFASHAFATSKAQVAELIASYKSMIDRWIASPPKADDPSGQVVIAAIQLFPVVSNESAASQS
jgi:uncharacterized protein (TIGR02147 family)